MPAPEELENLLGTMAATEPQPLPGESDETRTAPSPGTSPTPPTGPDRLNRWTHSIASAIRENGRAVGAPRLFH